MLAATLGSVVGGGGGSQAAEDGCVESAVGSAFFGRRRRRRASAQSSAGSRSLAIGRMPRGLRNLGAYGLGYTAQAYAYVLLLTDRYPNSDPEAIGPAWELPPHTVRLDLDDDGRRSRLTVFFRLLLAIPHFVWLALWTIAAFLAAIANGFVALDPRPLGGRAAPIPRRLRPLRRTRDRLRRRWSRTRSRASPAARATRSTSRSTRRERQNRWITLFRVFLVDPGAVLIASALSVALFVIVGLLGWFAALVTGRMPDGLRNLGAFAVRYLSQTNAYWFIVTDDYPHASPAPAPTA